MSDDFVDQLLTQWNAELPGLDFTGLGVFARLARFSHIAGKRIYKNLEPFGLNETQFNTLAALHRAGPPYQLSPKQLAKAMLLTPGAITYVIDQLENAGSVSRLATSADRRKFIIELTPEGKDRIKAAVEAHLAMCGMLLAPLEPAELATFINTLRRLLISVDDTYLGQGDADSDEKED